jgi:hypothetical protein
MSKQPVAAVRSGRQSRTALATPPRPNSETNEPRTLFPPFGCEPPDYENYRYGYPLFSGRMFGSGN